jgi:hypothetical protein
MLIPLVCNQCGGKLEVENSQVLESGDAVIILSDQTFKCPHCGIKYLPGEKIRHSSEKVVISIGGNANGATIIIGSGSAVNKNPGSTVPKGSQETKEYHFANPQAKINAGWQKPSKKWWRFWKA